MTNGSFMKVESIVEFINTFDLHEAIIGYENQFIVLRVAVLHRFYCKKKLWANMHIIAVRPLSETVWERLLNLLVNIRFIAKPLASLLLSALCFIIWPASKILVLIAYRQKPPLNDHAEVFQWG